MIILHILEIQGAMVTFQEQNLTDQLRIGVVLNSPAHKVQKHHWEKSKTNLSMAAPGQHKRVLMWNQTVGLFSVPSPNPAGKTVIRLNIHQAPCHPMIQPRRGSWKYPNTGAMSLSMRRFMQIVLNPFCVFAKALLRSLDNGFSVSKYITA